MFLFRALNDFDMLINPIKNGIASKKMIYDLTKRHLYNVEGSKMILMTEKQRDEYIKSYMPEFLKKYKYNLSKIFRERHI